jgi:hypothetical protein
VGEVNLGRMLVARDEIVVVGVCLGKRKSDDTVYMKCGVSVRMML